MPCLIYRVACLTRNKLCPPPVKQRSLHAQCARFVLGGRHWIEAQHIDGVFRLFRLPQPGTWRTSGPLALCGFVFATRASGAPIAGPMVLSRGNRRESFKAALYHSWPLPQSACNRGWFSPLFGSIGLTPILQSSFFESGPVGRAAGCLCRVQVATYVSLALAG